MTLSGLGDTAQNVLWTVFVIQGAAAVVFLGAGARLPAAKRDHFIITTMIVATASLAYYAMASGIGSVDIAFNNNELLEQGKKHLVTRPVFFARYIDWSITTPLLLVDVLLMARLPVSSAVWAIFADIAMILTGLIGALIGDQFRWGWFFFGCFAMVVVFATLYADGTKAVSRRDNTLTAFYTSTVTALVVLWTCYPIVWALGEGYHYISPDVEAYLYAILDVLAKVGWGGFILYNNERLHASYTRGRSDAEAPLVQE